ncbi:Response regulator receiver domain-containing protein [Zobellia uliginosa]|uniref:Response regulator receiver domain-containing protein n=1 Tax=Zobellia uliginosa TaxID=143224 RepID=A0ABY1KM15_9FLAO|nr:response regulator [Zobellia uliginosa]SIS48721.1 Response regulator receiver domain-containing protein [Zobellia uliginosa]
MSKTPKICIIDDDYIYRYTVVKKMENMRLDAKTLDFEDGEEALNYITDHLDSDTELPDVIFLDIDMPVMDGFQFLKEFDKIRHQLKKKISIYMISSSLDPIDIDRAKRANEICDYFVKPIKTEQLELVFTQLKAS